MSDRFPSVERQITFAEHGHLLTNLGCWSYDGQWIVYDVRSDPAGSPFDGTRIERVNLRSGDVQMLYESRHGANCGVVTASPVEDLAVFIHGPEHPAPDWQYAPNHRRGVIIGESVANLDACDLSPPFTPGALRGGSHVHVFSGDGTLVSFTYEDAVLTCLSPSPRGVGVSALDQPVRVARNHPRNHDGSGFSVLVTRVSPSPLPGSDQISRAFEDGWVGAAGYQRRDGSRQRHAIAFQGHVVTTSGETVSEVFIVDLPDDLTIAGDGPLQGTATELPFPPRGTSQRRLTFTAHRRFPGIQGPRHWLRSSADGSHIAFLMRDDAGIAQLCTISPLGGEPMQLTRNTFDVASAFTWSADGRWIAHTMDNSVCVTNATTGETIRLTPRSSDADAPRPEACVFSPDGSAIAFVRNVTATGDGRRFNQIFVVEFDAPAALGRGGIGS